MSQKIKLLEEKIEKTKLSLLEMKDIRPGSLSQQFRDPEKQEGGFWQLNCTFLGKTTTDYVRPDSLKTIRSEIKEYQSFKKKIDRLIELSIQLSRLRVKESKKSVSNKIG